MKPEVIDVTGLPPAVVSHLRKFVERLRNTAAEGVLTGPSPGELARSGSLA